MAERIVHFEVEGKAALGFDTGLSSQAFAQAKLTQFITQEGLIVYPDGKAEPWKPSGVIERRGSECTAEKGILPTMVIWGPDFTGERFDDLLLNDTERRDEALDALRLWIEVRSAAKDLQIPLWPAGALINLTTGAILFPPERLVMRSIQAEGEGAWLDRAESLVNPDLAAEACFPQGSLGRGSPPENAAEAKGRGSPPEDAAAFSAGAILYRILSGTLPFPNRNRDLLHQDIREGVFLPLGLAAPGLDEKTAVLVDRAIAASKNPPAGGRPGLEEFRELLGPVHSRGAASFFRTLDEAEKAKITEEREQFQKKKGLRVNTRRFVIRNAAIIIGISAAVLVVALIVRSMAASRASLPTTAGMESAAVVQAYYGAIGELDHPLMDACVFKKAGKGDIEMVTNLFVISKVRQAYESMGLTIIPAQNWIDSGAEPTESQVFGVSDLDIRKIRGDESGDEIYYRTSFILWLPAGMDSPADDPGNTGAEAGPNLPKGRPFTDELRLIRHKGNWRIAEITRNT
ncbi:hypothetical protein AGMMS49587_08800 [Spirochaetia bacterium]|nr:hypothetical protein AGMMS49587_08800 [Spirochaetia bacterium]